MKEELDLTDLQELLDLVDLALALWKTTTDRNADRFDLLTALHDKLCKMQNDTL